MFYPKKKHKILKLSLILIFSAAIGMFLGYASVRYENIPFLSGINSSSEPEKAEIPVEIPAPEPIYTNLTENNTIERDSTATAVPDDDKPGFTVKSDGSKVYLYKVLASGETKVEQTLPINLNALKNEDKKLLSEGINIKNKQELASILEDFGS